MEIEFIPDLHIYLIDGMMIPSVTSIIQKILPNKYEGINKKVLERKARYGTLGHKVIEEIGKNMMNCDEAMAFINDLYSDEKINQDLYISLRDYVRLSRKYNIEPLANEKVVHYKYEYVGTLDMIAYVNGKKALLDMKFTASLDREHLSWQLGMYKLASGEDFDEYYCIWLPKGKAGKLIPIEIKSEQEILNKLEELKNEGIL